MLELTVAATNRDEEPAITLQHTEDLTHLHPPTLALALTLAALQHSANYLICNAPLSRTVLSGRKHPSDKQ